MEDFKPVYLNDGDTWPDYLICTTCNQRVERGIVNVSAHWIQCTGKLFYQDIMETRKNKNYPLDVNDILKIKERHERQ